MKNGEILTGVYDIRDVKQRLTARIKINRGFNACVCLRLKNERCISIAAMFTSK